MTKKNQYKKVCGIYCIENLINGKKYIGQSQNIISRLKTHFDQLENNIHQSHDLQNDYNKFGIKNFGFKILEICSPDNLFIKEHEYIIKCNSVLNGYNNTYGGETGNIAIDSLSQKIQNDIQYIKEKTYSMNLEQEKRDMEYVLNKYKNIRMHSGSENQNNFQNEFFDTIKTFKKTDYRKRGVRSIQSILNENFLHFSISSHQERRRNENYSKSYWIIEEKIIDNCL